jgi:hypothetical protein
MISQLPSDRPVGDYVKQSNYHERRAARQSRRSVGRTVAWPPTRADRLGLTGHIQLWNHIRWNQDEYGMT